MSRPATDLTLPRKILVLGWYGTETIGDMAILAGLVARYRGINASVQFVVPSQYPAYTRNNVARTGLDVSVATYGDPELIGDLWGCDTVIIGGGPLMDIPEMNMLANVFERAYKSGRQTIVDGCGVGPVNNDATRQAIARIIAASDHVRVRDRESGALIERLGFDRPIAVVDDPGRTWLQSTGIRHHRSPTGAICVFARELTSEYPQATSPTASTEALVDLLRRMCDWFPERTVSLHAMHHFPVGGDDRVYARRLVKAIDRPSCIADGVPRTPLETAQIVAGAVFVVGMRFHSIVFADTVGTPFLAIDYTDGGKVAHYTHERRLHQRCVPLDGLSRVTRPQLVELGLPEKLAFAS